MDIVSERSPFLRLPAEIRNNIYQSLLGGHVIHIGGTSHQPYSEGHLPNGRCCSCTADLSDEDCFARYTLQGKPLKGALPHDRFPRRHRDCHRYPVSRHLPLKFLSVCKQIHREAASIVFEENEFTLTRPSSLGDFLAKLNWTQLKSIRTITIYSIESFATWIGPFHDYDLGEYLTGFQRLRVFMEMKWHYIRNYGSIEEYMKPAVMDHRMSGLSMFKTPRLSVVEVMILSQDWEDVDAEDLSARCLEGLRGWERNISRILLPE